MVYSDSLHHPGIAELARSGNLRAISQWLNQVLIPYGMRALVGMARPGCLKILVEVEPLPQEAYKELAEPLRDSLIRFVCHRLWRLNSAAIEGVRIGVRFVGDRKLLWQQSVRIATPARRSKRQQSHKLRSKIRQTARRGDRLKTARVVLMSGSTVAAFLCGGIIAFVKSPVDQSAAVSSPRSGTNLLPSARPDTVKTALESVPVVKHTQVANPQDPTVTMMFAGDVSLSDSFAEQAGSNVKWAFAQMGEYRQADLAMVNLETPLTQATDSLPDKQFNFKADPELSAKILTDGGIDVVNLANNHIMDYQEPGLVETMTTLDKAGIGHLGAGRNLQEARRPEIIDVKGQRIAYLGYYGADFQSAGPTTAGANYAEEKRIAEDIQAIRGQVDWIVVNYHWGDELASHPADWQRQLAYFTIDQGADLVVGHHPHVLQGAEIYKGKPIAYSLGNFIFGGNSRSDYDTAVLKVSVKDRQMKAEFLPVEVRNYQPKVVTGDRGNEILQNITHLSSGFQEPMRSPVVLESQPLSPSQVSGAPAVAPMSQPANSGDLGTPTVASPTAPDPALSIPPVSPSSAPSPEASSAPGAEMPQSSDTPSQSSGSFTTAPGNTPFNAATPEAWPSPAASPSP